MKIELFVSESFKPCREAVRISDAVAKEEGLELTVVDIADPAGRRRADELGIAVIPALAVDGRLLAIGVQTHGDVRDLLAAARR